MSDSHEDKADGAVVTSIDPRLSGRGFRGHEKWLIACLVKALHKKVTILQAHLLQLTQTSYQSLWAETTVYSDRLSLYYPLISDAFDNLEYFFCIKQMIQL